MRKIGAPSGTYLRSIATDLSDVMGTPSAPIGPGRPSGKILKGEERKIFETKKIKLDVLKSEKIIGIN